MDVLNNLEILNSKERFYLFIHAIGTPRLNLSKGFIDSIQQLIKKTIPNDYFSAIDYHLNWLYAATHIDVLKDKYEHDNTKGIIRKNIEDIDLIIAFKENNNTIIIMIEAKATGSWTNAQIQSKLKRLDEIFDSETRKFTIPFLILMSPHPPQNLKSDNAANWTNAEGKFNWIELQIPQNLKMVSLIDKTGLKWKITNR
jgi:hypothetical protein